MDNINNNTVGDNQSNGMGLGNNDVNNGSTPVQANDYNSMQPTPSPVISDDLVGSLTGMPTPEVGNAPIGVQPVQESTPPVEQAPLEENMTTPFGSSPASFDTATPTAMDTVTPTPMDTVTPTPMDTVTPLSVPVIESTPSFGSTPVMDESVSATPIEASTPVVETQPMEESVPVETSPVVDSSPAFETPSPEAMPTPESIPTEEMGTQSLSEPLPSFVPPTDTPMPVTQGEEVVSNLNESKEVKSGKGGTAVIIVLIIVIVALLGTIGFFAFKIFG